jgi:hypothetical protein
MSKSIPFEQALESTDFGFIVCSKTGRLKGLWIPDGLEEQPVPLNIVQLCTEYFGIDPNNVKTDSDGKIIH